MAKQPTTMRGIIDLGSNTIRLVVYQVKTNAAHGNEGAGKVTDFKALLNEKRVVGLSSYVEDNALTSAGIEKAADVLARHLNLAKNIGCTDVRIFATAVIRNLVNRKQAVQELERLCGKTIEVLSGKDESHLGFVGARYSTDMKDGLLVDIGGGSTELTFLNAGKEHLNLSIDRGCVSSYADLVSCIFPTEKETKSIRSAFEDRLDAQKDLPSKIEGTLYGIGGSVRAIAKLHARVLGSDKAAKHIALSNVESILALAKKDANAFAHLATKAVPDRIHTVLPGCIILKALMKRYKKDELIICKYGVREGYLLSSK